MNERFLLPAIVSCLLLQAGLVGPLVASSLVDEPDYRWVWVQKIDNGKFEDATVTSLAVGADGLWIGGQYDNKHYIQQMTLSGQPQTARIFLGKGDSVNDLVLGSSGEVFGAADIWTSASQRPGYFFARRANGAISGTRLGTSTPNGAVGYGDAYGVARSGQWIYVTGYLNPERLSASRLAFFGDKSVDLSGANLPEGAYAAFLVKINSGNGAVEWARFLGADFGDSVKAGSDGNVYVAGADFDWNGPGFLKCFSAAGSLLWTSQTDSFVNSLALDSGGDVWVSNRFAGTLQKFGRGGGGLELALPLPGAVVSLAVGSHPSGGVVALGHGQEGFQVYRVDAGGGILWSKMISGGLAFRGNWSKVSVTQSGDIYIAFSAASSSDYDSSAAFSRVAFEGRQTDFPFAQDDETSKGFVALLRDFSSPPPNLGGSRPQTITFVLPQRLVCGRSYTLDARAGSNLPVSYQIDNPAMAEITEDNRLKILQAGTFTVTARQNGDTLWAAADPVSIEATSERRPQFISFSARRFVRVGQTFTLRASASSGLPLDIESSDPSVIQVNGSNATALSKGKVKLTATQEGDGNNLAAKPAIRTVTVR